MRLFPFPPPQRRPIGSIAIFDDKPNAAIRDPHDTDRVADLVGGALLAFGASGHYIIPSTETNIDRQLEETNNGNMGKCTNEHGQIIYNAITLFRDDVRHRGTVIAFMGSANGAIVVSDTPDQILKSAKG